MFFATQLKEGTTYKFDESEVEKGDVLNITNICLSSEASTSAQFFVRKDGVEYLVYSLTGQRNQQTINIFLKF